MKKGYIYTQKGVAYYCLHVHENSALVAVNGDVQKLTIIYNSDLEPKATFNLKKTTTPEIKSVIRKFPKILKLGKI